MIVFLKKKWYLIIGILTVGLLVFFGLRSELILKKSAKDKKEYLIKREDLREVLSLSGTIDAEEKVTLRFQSSGRLAWVGVKEGDYVKKYQTIASLDQRELQKTLQKYLNLYVNERYDFEQTHDNYWQKQYALSDGLKREAERIIKKSQSELDNAVIDVELRNLALEYANLWTPIEGIVTKISVPFAGVNITPAQAEFEIINPKTFYFSATVEQVDVINLKEGMTGEIKFDAFPDDEYKGKIYFISYLPKEGETGTVYQLKIELDEKAKKLPLRLSMTGDITFITKERRNVLAVPASYIKKDKNGSYLMIAGKGDKKNKQYIKLGEEIDGKFIIKSGIRENTLIYD